MTMLIAAAALGIGAYIGYQLRRAVAKLTTLDDLHDVWGDDMPRSVDGEAIDFRNAEGGAR